ncbi:MAG: carbohydrate kinase, partial [Gammaproteobacteria bacterium]|nr:carbohydrate kinase [Gammaproteobacteria bacterium]
MGQRSSRIPAAGTLNDPLLLAIDLGSQSVRARLYDRQGQSHARADVALREPQSRHNGWAEHEPGYLQGAVADACCEALLAADLRQRVAGVGLTTVRASVVLVDRKGTPLRPIIMWSDKRRLRQPPQPRGIARLAHYLPLLGPTLRQVQGEAECNWVARHEAKTWANTHKMLLLSGYLNHWLTGNFLDAAAAQVGYVPFDPRRGDWAGERNWRWQLLPVLNRGMLPDLRPVSTALGRVCERAAAATRIPPGTPVIASAGDKACEVLGSAPARKATAYLSLGTAAATNLYTDTYRQPHWLMPAFPAAIPGHWLLERQIDRGMSVVGSFAQQIGASLPDIDARDRAQPAQLLQ